MILAREDLAREDLPEPVALLGCEAGQLDRQPRHVFLIGGQPERPLQGPLQPTVQRDPASSVQAPEVFAYERVGRWANDRGVDHEVREVPALTASLELSHGGRLDVEAADRLASREHLYAARVLDHVEGFVGRRLVSVLLGSSQRVANHRQRTVPEEVDLDQARLLDALLLPLENEDPLGRSLDRAQVADRTWRDHDAARVNREVAREA